MDIMEAIKTMVDILNKEPNLRLIDIDVTPRDAYIKIIIWKPPKELKEIPDEGSHQISETRPAKLKR